MSKITIYSQPPDGNWHYLHFDGACWPNPGGTLRYGYVIRTVLGTAGIRPDGSPSTEAPMPSEVHRGPVVVWRHGIGELPDKTYRKKDFQSANAAEYIGLVEGLRHALRLGIRRICVCGDSKLALNQMTGQWKCKAPHLKSLCNEARALHRCFTRITTCHVGRKGNEEADALADTVKWLKGESADHGLIRAGKGPEGFSGSENSAEPGAPGSRKTLYSVEQAAMIRWLGVTKRIGASSLSRIYGGNHGTISSVISGKTYSEVGEEDL